MLDVDDIETEGRPFLKAALPKLSLDRFPISSSVSEGEASSSFEKS